VIIVVEEVVCVVNVRGAVVQRVLIIVLRIAEVLSVRSAGPVSILLTAPAKQYFRVIDPPG
jgi:hypothetical protein